MANLVTFGDSFGAETTGDWGDISTIWHYGRYPALGPTTWVYAADWFTTSGFWRTWHTSDTHGWIGGYVTIAAPVQVSGSGLNDAFSGGAATPGSGSHTYNVRVSSIGTPDFVQWNRDGGSYSTPVGITAFAPVTMMDGVQYAFGNATGHTAGNSWNIVTTQAGTAVATTGRDADTRPVLVITSSGSIVQIIRSNGRFSFAFNVDLSGSLALRVAVRRLTGTSCVVAVNLIDANDNVKTIASGSAGTSWAALTGSIPTVRDGPTGPMGAYDPTDWDPTKIKVISIDVVQDGTLGIEYIDLAPATDALPIASRKVANAIVQSFPNGNPTGRFMSLTPGTDYTVSLYASAFAFRFEFKVVQTSVLNFGGAFLDWIANTSGGTNLGCTSINHSGGTFVICDLDPGDPTKATGEVSILLSTAEADATAEAPGLTALSAGGGSYNLTECPFNLFGHFSSLSGLASLRVFSEDASGHRRYGPVRSTFSGGDSSSDICSTTPDTGVTIESGYDPGHIVLMGVQFTATGGPFTGTVQLVTYTMSTPDVNVRSGFMGLSFWERLTWTFTAPTWAGLPCELFFVTGADNSLFCGFQLVAAGAPEDYVAYDYTPRIDGTFVGFPAKVEDNTELLLLTGNIECFPEFVSNPAKPKYPYGINFRAPNDYTPEWWFLDSWKQSRGWTLGTVAGGSDWDTGGYGQAIPAGVLARDSDGWITALASGQAAYNLMQRDSAHFPNGDYVFTYEGSGTYTFDSDVLGPHESYVVGSPVESPTNHFRVIVHKNPGTNGILFKLLTTNPANPMKNMKLIMPGYEAVADAQIFHPDWLSRLNMFQTFRFMEATDTNNSEIGDWSLRTPLSYYTYANFVAPTGIPYETAIDICNRALVDCWICVPMNADDNYIEQMAILFRDNLNPRLRLWVEYGNENWNGAFKMGFFSEEKGRLGTATTPAGLAASVFGGAGTYFENQIAYYVFRTMQIHQIYERIFSGAQRFLRPIKVTDKVKAARVRRVLGGWQNIPSMTLQQLHALEYFYHGYFYPDALASSAYHPTSQVFVNDSGAQINKTVAQLFAAAAAQVSALQANFVLQKAAADSIGATMCAYEGGANWIPPWYLTAPIGPDTVTEALAATRDNRIQNMYRDLVGAWRAAGCNELNFYDSVDALSKFGMFSMLEWTTQPEQDAPKYRIIKELIGQDVQTGFPKISSGRAGAGKEFYTDQVWEKGNFSS